MNVNTQKKWSTIIQQQAKSPLNIKQFNHREHRQVICSMHNLSNLHPCKPRYALHREVTRD